MEHLTRKLLRFESNYTDFVPRLYFFQDVFTTMHRISQIDIIIQQINYGLGTSEN
jgi:hypothetical protein